MSTLGSALLLTNVVKYVEYPKIMNVKDHNPSLKKFQLFLTAILNPKKIKPASKTKKNAKTN
jgi:hypothetical protein